MPSFTQQPLLFLSYCELKSYNYLLYCKNHSCNETLSFKNCPWNCTILLKDYSTEFLLNLQIACWVIFYFQPIHEKVEGKILNYLSRKMLFNLSEYYFTWYFAKYYFLWYFAKCSRTSYLWYSRLERNYPTLQIKNSNLKITSKLETSLYYFTIWKCFESK